jgi:iron complex transport system substrate-binding protein
MTNDESNWQHFLRAIALALLTFWLVCACGSNNPSEVGTISDSECRPVKHAMGETCVPLTPQRIITLGGTTLESALAMNVRPLASQTDILPHLEDKLDGITVLGWPLNLEKVVALKPNLIIGSADGQEQQSYQLLSRIAPTVLAETETSGDWKAVVQFVGKVLGKPEAAERVLARYNQRLAAFKQHMGERLQETEVSVVRLYPDKISLYLKDSFIGTILADAGLARPPSQQLNASQALAFAGNPIQVSINKERLQDIDGDVIFVMLYDYQPAIEKELQTTLEQLQDDPLWSRLEAVERDEVYSVASYWLGSGPLAANAVIDDLYQYLMPDNLN